MKKQIIKLLKILILCILCVGVFCSCARVETNKKDGSISIVTLGFPQYDIARAVCGNDANIRMLIRPGTEAHNYEPSISDIVAIENADVFIYNGGESDVWVDKILSSLRNRNIKIVSFMDVEKITLYKESSIHHSHSHGGEHIHHNKHKTHSYDEHIWTSPKNMMVLVENVCDVLCEINPEMSNIYKGNAQKYLSGIIKLDEELEAIAGESSHKLIAVADRFPFLYLAKDYDIEYMALFSGCSPEGDAGPVYMAEMIGEIKHHSIDSVFHIELSNEKMADVICENTGAKKLLLHSCQNVSKEEFESGKTYLDIMKQNIENLKEALL